MNKNDWEPQALECMYAYISAKMCPYVYVHAHVRVFAYACVWDIKSSLFYYILLYFYN